MTDKELDPMKQCSECGEYKARCLKFFGPYKGRSVDGLRPNCRECRRVYDREWQAAKRKKNKPA